MENIPFYNPFAAPGNDEIEVRKKAKWKRNKAKLKYLCLCHKNINLFIGVETVEALEASKNSMRKGFFLFSYWCLLACWCSLLLLKCSIGLNHLVLPNCHVLVLKSTWLKAFFSCKNAARWYFSRFLLIIINSYHQMIWPIIQGLAFQF